MKHSLTPFAGALMLATVLAACGGGTDGTGALPPPNTTVTSSGVMTKGSVILNGTRFEPAGASIVDDRGRTAAQLENGMVIKLRGRSDDGVSGIADQIDVENEARGPVQSIDAAASPGRFTVAGLAVVVDSDTVFAGLAGFSAISVGLRVEVHGLRDSTGVLRASRIEGVTAQNGSDEVRGALSSLAIGPKQFTLNGAIRVTYAGATFLPAGASEALLTAGAVVEVRGTLNGNTFSATRVEIEALEDAPYQGGANENQDVEGFITGFTTHPGAFLVNGRAVVTSLATKFEAGTAADLDNDIKVEVDGVINAQSVLVATKVKFKQNRVTVGGLATAVDVNARTLTVNAQTIRVNDLTRIDARVAGGGKSESLADISPNVDCVDVRGHMENSQFVAERIRELNECPTTARMNVAPSR